MDPSQDSQTTIESRVTGSKLAMSLIGIDEKVATEAGFEIVRDDSGKAIGVKKPGEDFTTAGHGYAEGDCGFSEIDFDSYGGNSAEVTPYFYVFDAAVAYHWGIDIFDARGQSVQTWAGGLNLEHQWIDSRHLPNLARGTACAFTNSTSTVLLWWGGICGALDPSACTTVF